MLIQLIRWFNCELHKLGRAQQLLTLLFLLLCFSAALKSGSYFAQRSAGAKEPNTYSKAIIVIDTGAYEDDMQTPFVVSDVPIRDNLLPLEMCYRDVDDEKALAWLDKRGSLLADGPYYGMLKKTAQDHDVSVLLLLAIIGQEQGFVKRTHPNAYEIVNNPFNVYGSWEDYNTDFEESVGIACRTIRTLAVDCPDDAQFIQWINTRGGQGGYANDQHWWEGVNYFYEVLTKELAGG